MRLILEAPFDIGAVFGLDDSAVLDAGKVADFKERSQVLFGTQLDLYKTPVIDALENGDDAKSIPYGVQAPFGFGLRLKVVSGPLLDAWRQDAKAFWQEYADTQRHELGDAAFSEVEELLETISIRHVHLFLFAMGVAYVRVEMEEFEAPSAESVRGLYKAYEFGAYGDLTARPAADTANTLLAAWRDAARAVFSKDSPIVPFLQREMPSEKVEIPGFVALVLLVETDSWSSTEPRLFRAGDDMVSLSYGDAQLGITGWLIAAKNQTPGVNSFSRLLYVVMICNVSGELCRTHDRWLTNKVRAHTTVNLQRRSSDTFSRNHLNRLKQFAALLCSMTDVSEISEHAGDHRLAKIFEDSLRLKKRRERIESASTAFAHAEADEIAAEESRQSQRLNLILFILAVISLVGVAASVIGSWEEGIRLLSTPYLLATVLAGPCLLVIVAGLGIWKKSRH